MISLRVARYPEIRQILISMTHLTAQVVRLGESSLLQSSPASSPTFSLAGY